MKSRCCDGSEMEMTAYITDLSDKYAKAALREVDTMMIDGKHDRATQATTRYCDYFLDSAHCQDIKYALLHEVCAKKLDGAKHREKQIISKKASNSLLSTCKESALNNTKWEKRESSIMPQEE